MAIWMCLLPVWLVISSISTFIVSYSLAVTHNHTDAFLPYISDTATTPPECCIFGLMTFIAALACVGTMYAQLEFGITRLETGNGHLKRLNLAAFIFGLVSCLGMCIVATFQETLMKNVHRAGALGFFMAGVAFIIMQTFISWHTGRCKAIFCIRLIIAIVAFPALVALLVCISLITTSDKLHWTGYEKDYDLHIASAVCEWVVALCFVFHFGTYTYDFWDCTVTVTANLGNSYERLRADPEQ